MLGSCTELDLIIYVCVFLSFDVCIDLSRTSFVYTRTVGFGCILVASEGWCDVCGLRGQGYDRLLLRGGRFQMETVRKMYFFV